jgi:non-specific serine/threonine protein kinase
MEFVLNELVDAFVREACMASSPSRRISGSRGRNAAEAWLKALSSPDPTVNAPVAGMRALERRLEGWLEPVRAADAAFRTCFRLSAPSDPEASPSRAISASGPRQAKGKRGAGGRRAGPVAGEKWRIDFLLQATDDASLLVPSDRVWRSRSADLALAGRRLGDAAETLLADLARASRLFPPIESALSEAAPSGVDLATTGAHAFLRETAPLLEQAGFGVLVPPWWRNKPTRLGVRLSATPQPESDGRFGLDAICDYEWKLALGDETLTLDEFRKLARLKVPLVRTRGQWVELRPEDIEAALSLIEGDTKDARMTAADVVRVGLGIASSPAGLPVLGLDAGDWLDELLASADRPARRLKAPPGFEGTLRPYQERGLAWLSFLDGLGIGACLADDMGLGKTIQLLALLVAEHNGAARSGSDGRRRRSPEQRSGRRTSRSTQASGEAGPTLLVCPMSVVGNWQHEAERFAPGLRVHVHHGAERPAGSAFKRAVNAADLVITTYALAARDRDRLADLKWERMVLDEAQNIKNSAALQARAVRAIPAARRIALTGTPVENRLSELWSIFEFLNPGLLGGATEFRNRFARPIERYRDEEAAARLKRATSPFILRRLKTDRAVISDLPDKIEMKVYCNLTREQATLYQAVVDEMLEKIASSDGMSRRGLVLSTMMKLKQVCNHPAQMLADRSAIAGRSGKLSRLVDILEEVIEAGDRALVFTQFTEMGHMLEDHLRERFGQAMPFLHGATTKKARDAMVARFQSDDAPPVLLISLRAGGTGLNLTAASHVVHFDRWWNPAVEDQATDRAFRIGQKRNVQVRKFICTGTLEERIDMMIEEKKDLAERIVGAGEAWLTELSTDELRDIVALSADAVVE